MINKVVFRVDAASHIGTGHLQRCLTLAHEFFSDGWQITFAMINFDKNICDLVDQHGFKLLLLSKGNSQIDSSDEKSWLSREQIEDAYEFCDCINGENYDLCIIDHYSIDYIWQDYVHKTIPCLVMIDDLANRTHRCEILLDQNFFPDHLTRYDKLIDSSTCIPLLGPTYALLRKEFSLLREQRIDSVECSNNSVPTILCNFGGIGNFNILKILLEVARDISLYNFIIITGKLIDKEFEELLQISNCCENVSLLMATNNMAELMCKADFCLGASGSTVWERFCLGLNSALIAVADNQKSLLVFLNKKDLIDNLGLIQDVSSNTLRRYFQNLNFRDNLYITRREKIMSLVDGQGAQRVYQAIQEYLRKC